MSAESDENPEAAGLLQAIAAATHATGAHSANWGELRARAFPGAGGWQRLQDWCGAQRIDCAIAYASASRGAEVIFRKAGRKTG